MAYLWDRPSLKTEVGNNHIIKNIDILQSDILGDYCYTSNNIASWHNASVPIRTQETEWTCTSVPLFVHKVMHTLLIFAEAWMRNVFLTDLINTPTYIKKNKETHTINKKQKANQ